MNEKDMIRKYELMEEEWDRLEAQDPYRWEDDYWDDYDRECAEMAQADQDGEDEFWEDAYDTQAWEIGFDPYSGCGGWDL